MRYSLVTSGATALALCSCASGSTNTTPTATEAIVATTGNNQIGLWGDNVTVLPAARVTDNTGNPIAGVVVTFSASGPANGTVVGATQTTGADGVATVGGWKLGTPGTNVLTATAVGETSGPAQFVATSMDQLVITRPAGIGQSVHAGTAVSTPPEIQINGFYSQAPIAGATVTWTVTGGGGTVTGATTTTDAHGVASVGSWTLGPIAGANQLTATVTWPGSWTITFAATGTP